MTQSNIIPLGVSPGRKMYALLKLFKQGFFALEERKNLSLRDSSSDWIRCAHQSIGVCNRKTNDSTDRVLYMSSSSRRKYFKRSLNLMESLMGSRDQFSLSNGEFRISGKGDEGTDILSSDQIKGEYYFPFAFYENNELKGGAYLNFKSIGDSKQVEHLSSKGITEFHTGGCFFGSTMVGIDQFGKEHSLTNPHYQIPDNVTIVSIVAQPDLHPDEVLTRESLKNFVVLLKCLAKDGQPILNYHLPEDNYLLYALNWYAHGALSDNAFHEYVAHVRQRSADMRRFLSELADAQGITVVYRSSLESLNFRSYDSHRFLAELVSDYGLSGVSDLTLPDKLLRLFKDRLLFCGSSEAKTLWHEALNTECESIKHFNSLLDLNYIDYSASLALSVVSSEDSRVCSLLPLQEAPVVHFYKKLFANSLPNKELLYIQWLPPFLVHIEDFQERAFYISDYLDLLSEVSLTFFIRECFMLTASQVDLRSDLNVNYESFLKSIIA